MLANVARLDAMQREEQDGFIVPAENAWPSLADEAYHGVVGDYARKIEPHTEADPAGILIQMMVMFGNLVGRGPHFRVENDRHALNLFAVLVGQSSKGRKGVSAGQAKRLFEATDPAWCARIEHGLSSGEGLIWAVRDPVEKTQSVREQGKPTGEVETVVVDAGVDDKRLFVLESEFASVLKMLKRDGNILSPIIRNAWDSGQLSTLTKNTPAKATGAHISIVGHITKTELLRTLHSTETANGFGNRFLWCCVQRTKYLAEGGEVHTLDFSRESAELADRLSFAKGTEEIRKDPEARKLWAEVYPQLSEGRPGLAGAMTGRSEAQTMRLACLYALLDRSHVIRADHLLAALALWTYCDHSARWIFGDALGDPIADEILLRLRQSPEGLTKNQIGNAFNRHRKRHEIGRALALLRDTGLATCEKEPTGGRTAERWRAAPVGCELSEKSELSP